MDSNDVIKWVNTFPRAKRSATFVVPKSDTESTYFLFDRNRDLTSEAWLADGVANAVFSKTASMPLTNNRDAPIWFPPEKGSWELLWGLISVRDFIIDEPLKSLVDDGSFLAFEFYRLLWEARFLTTENLNLSKAQEIVHTITRWVTGRFPSDQDKKRFQDLDLRGNKLTLAQRYDLLCMFFTLLKHNGLVRNQVFSFACIETALGSITPSWGRELELFLSCLDRWILMGSCPIGVLLGFDDTAENMERLREVSPKLAQRIERGLEVTC